MRNKTILLGETSFFFNPLKSLPSQGQRVCLLKLHTQMDGRPVGRRRAARPRRIPCHQLRGADRSTVATVGGVTAALNEYNPTTK